MNAAATARRGCWVQLDRSSAFITVFPDREAPVTRYLPHKARFEGDPCGAGWQLDWERCTEAQRERLLGIYVRQSGLTLNEVAEEVKRTGIGIRASSAILAKDYDTGRTLMA